MAPSRKLLVVPDPAPYAGRYHRAGQPGVMYASSSEAAGWAEFFRHFDGDGIDPLEVLRRIGRIRVSGLAVLDLTDPDVRRQHDVTVANLVGDDLSVCHKLADVARSLDLDGVLGPSAALEGERTLAVFPAGMACLRVETSIVRSPR